MERPYDDLKFADVFKKRFSEGKNAAQSAGRLKLVLPAHRDEELRVGSI